MTTKALSPEAQALLSNISDLKQRKQLEAILRGSVIKQLYCLDPRHPHGSKDPIANQYKNGRFEILYSPNELGEDVAWLRAWRQRLDGFTGFECWCGNDSRIASQEQGIVTDTVSKEGIEQIAQIMSVNPASYPVVNGEQEIDGFLLKDVG